MNAAHLAEAIAVIVGERQYQYRKWGDNPHSLLEFLVYIKNYTEEAIHAESRLPDAQANELSRHTLRKVAALAVAAMQQHGVRQREDEGDRPVGADVRGNLSHGSGHNIG